MGDATSKAVSRLNTTFFGKNSSQLIGPRLTEASPDSKGCNEPSAVLERPLIISPFSAKTKSVRRVLLQLLVNAQRVNPAVFPSDPPNSSPAST